MTDPAIRIAVAFCVLLTGACAALFFRHAPLPSTTPVVEVPQQLLIRRSVDGAIPGLPSSAALAQPRGIAERAPTIVTPSDSREPPPPLADSYPQTQQPASSRWGVSMEMMLPVAAPSNDAGRVHRIADGDTLPALAERYLGSADRAIEIFEANRDILSSPALLPIAADLRIPPANARAPGSSP